MTVRRTDLDNTQARYVQTAAELEKDALATAKAGDLKAIKEVVLSVKGDVASIAQSVATLAASAMTSSGPLRDRLLSAGNDDLENQIMRLTAKTSDVIETRRGEEMTVAAADLLANLRDAARDESPKEIAKALVAAVAVRGISHGEWKALLERMATIKSAGPELTHLSNREAKRALVNDLVKLFYEPLLDALKTS